jgi:ACS family D-galactonate transporter-like MFS transporter
MASAAAPATEPVKYSKAYLWNIILMLAVSQAIAYMDRVNMSVVAPVLIKQYKYSPATVGVLMSMFNWAYMAALIFAGPFVDWVRARVAYPLGVGIWSVATALCGTTLSVGPLAAFRALVGVGEAAMIPSGQRVIFETFPKEQRGSVVGTFFAGNKVGLALGIPFSAMILASWGVPWVFYVTGIISALWIPWFLATYRGKGRGVQPPVKSNIRWGTLMKYRSTWGIMFGQAGYLYTYYVFASWLPTYLVVQRKMSILKGGFVGMLPFVVGVIATVLGGYMSDWLVKRTSSVTIARKLMTCGGLFLAAVFTLAGAYSAGVWVAVTYLTLAVASFSLATGSCNSMSVDLAPPHIVSSLVSLQNFGGNVGGALAPVVTGILLARSHNDFQIPLLVTAGVALVFGCGAYGLIVGSLERSIGSEETAQGTTA